MMKFMERVLNQCMRQDTDVLEMQPRLHKEPIATEIEDGYVVRAEDDGGLCSVKRVGGEWVVNNPYLALFEAKKALHGFDKVPIIHNKTLAQFLGEAIVTWKEKRNLVDEQ